MPSTSTSARRPRAEAATAADGQSVPKWFVRVLRVYTDNDELVSELSSDANHDPGDVLAPVRIDSDGYMVARGSGQPLSESDADRLRRDFVISLLKLLIMSVRSKDAELFKLRDALEAAQEDDRADTPTDPQTKGNLTMASTQTQQHDGANAYTLGLSAPDDYQRQVLVAAIDAVGVGFGQVAGHLPEGYVSTLMTLDTLGYTIRFPEELADTPPARQPECYLCYVEQGCKVETRVPRKLLHYLHAFEITSGGQLVNKFGTPVNVALFLESEKRLLQYVLTNVTVKSRAVFDVEQSDTINDLRSLIDTLKWRRKEARKAALQRGNNLSDGVADNGKKAKGGKKSKAA